MCTISFTTGAGVSGFTWYVPSNPLSLLPGACGEEVQAPNEGRDLCCERGVIWYPQV
jgi:hypothetical protein